MAADIDTIQAGMMTAIAGVSGIRHRSTRWPDAVNPPHAWATFAGDGGLVTLGGDDSELRLQLWLMVRAGEHPGQGLDEINDYVSSTGAKSIRKTLFDDGDLDGTVSGILDVSLESVGRHEVHGLGMIGAIWNVRVYAE